MKNLNVFNKPLYIFLNLPGKKNCYVKKYKDNQGI
ncbi:MAG: hypothetical protein KatS3mg034_1872 [Vicingaceae bacterium]|nr:MAG: hypothetical protein KatS3mg034_1872 [Vicingaceae bacterium]